MSEEIKSLPSFAPLKPSYPPAGSKANVGDHVMLVVDVDAKGNATAVQHAIVTAIDAGNVASLKVLLPATRQGGGGIAEMAGVKFSDKASKGCWKQL